MLANLLQTVGIEYVVFERDASPTPTSKFLGGTLDIHGTTGQLALRRAGLSEKFERLARRDATTMMIQDSSGGNRRTFGEDRDAPEIDRLQLRQLLLESLPAECIQWDKALVAAERDGNQQQPGAADVQLRFGDGSTQSGFRLVVGADGSRSKIRPLVRRENTAPTQVPSWASFSEPQSQNSPSNQISSPSDNIHGAPVRWQNVHRRPDIPRESTV